MRQWADGFAKVLPTVECLALFKQRMERYQHNAKTMIIEGIAMIVARRLWL